MALCRAESGHDALMLSASMSVHQLGTPVEVRGATARPVLILLNPVLLLLLLEAAVPSSSSLFPSVQLLP
jgi:hypothetical protein